MNDIRYMLKATFISEEPFSIGSGFSDASEFDVLTDSNGKPFIPGSSISGVFRHYLEEHCGVTDADVIFGDSYEEKEDDETVQLQRRPSIIFYDAFSISGCEISVRDSVAIDNNGVAVDGEKFDSQIVEAGAKFELRLEFVNEGINEARINELLCLLLDGVNSGDMRFGHKSSRGRGLFRVCEVRVKKYDLNTDFSKYLDFSWDKVIEPYKYPHLHKSKKYTCFSYKLELTSFLMIRDYITDAVDPYNSNKPVDSEQLKNADGIPVIPGTAWAGVFRHNFRRILTDCGWENPDAVISNIFGWIEKNKKTAVASNIVFGESVLEGSHEANRTRTAIDRFTSGAADKKLFTVRSALEGTTELKIWLNNKCDNFKLAKDLIEITMDDLSEGYVNVGGDGSIGGGIFKVIKEGGTDD